MAKNFRKVVNLVWDNFNEMLRKQLKYSFKFSNLNHSWRSFLTQSWISHTEEFSLRTFSKGFILFSRFFFLFFLFQCEVSYSKWGPLLRVMPWASADRNASVAHPWSVSLRQFIWLSWPSNCNTKKKVSKHHTEGDIGIVSFFHHYFFQCSRFLNVYFKNIHGKVHFYLYE